MSTNWAIVAIPADEDPVWKISSEKVPHLTLLFLGEQESGPTERTIANFLLHVVNTSVTRFGMNVDHRGVLGPKEADVLFFGEHNRAKLDTLRSNLLQNQEIAEAYNSTMQYDSWTPHLTLGFPETPAHEDTREYPGIPWVNFNRIALWTGDYDGYEFQLKGDELMALAHSSRSYLGKTLTHVGVKGMKWGRRKGVALSPSEDHIEAKRISAKKPSQMSNKELQTINNRKQLEKKYKDLNPSTVKQGQQRVAAVLAIGATITAVTAMANGPVGRMAKSAIDRAIKASMTNGGKHVLNEAVKTTARHLA